MKERIDKKIANEMKENFEGLFKFEYAPQGIIVSYNKGGLNNEAVFDITEENINIFDRQGTLMFEKSSKDFEKNPSFWAGVIAGLLMGL